MRSVRALVSSQKTSGQWAYIVRMKTALDAGDNSNTQFALLALHAAAAKGVKIPKIVWKEALHEHFVKSIGVDGGWGYGCPGVLRGSYGSMTAAGVVSLAIARAGMLGPERARGHDFGKEPRIAAGPAWLAKRFMVEKHPGIPSARPTQHDRSFVPFKDGTFQYYWLYSLERVGRVLGLTRIGEHDRYREGAEWLLARQNEDGSFANPDDTFAAPEPPLPATCFALLFLNRATLPVVTPGPGEK